MCGRGCISDHRPPWTTLIPLHPAPPRTGPVPKDICLGEEITVDYGRRYFQAGLRCLCGAPDHGAPATLPPTCPPGS